MIRGHRGARAADIHLVGQAVERVVNVVRAAEDRACRAPALHALPVARLVVAERGQRRVRVQDRDQPVQGIVAVHNSLARSHQARRLHRDRVSRRVVVVGEGADVVGDGLKLPLAEAAARVVGVGRGDADAARDAGGRLDLS